MDQSRKKIIVNEIKFWKENRLLPEQYCNYLLALYSEGEEIEDKPKRKETKIHPLYLLSFLPLITFICVYYFTEFSIFFQLPILVICLIGNGLFLFLCKKKELNEQIPLATSLFLLLLESIYISKLLTTSTMILFSIVSLNCILWIVIGSKWKLVYFIISGIVGLLLIGLSLFL